MVTVTQSGNTKKVIESSRTDDIIVIRCLNTNNFIFLFFYFSDFISIFFSFILLLDDEVAHDTVT